MRGIGQNMRGIGQTIRGIGEKRSDYTRHTTASACHVQNSLSNYAAVHVVSVQTDHADGSEVDIKK